MQPLPLGHQFIPLLCFQLLTNLLILWIALLKPQVRKNPIHPFQEKQKLFKPSFLPCSLSYRSLLLNHADLRWVTSLPRLHVFFLWQYLLHDSLETEMEIQRHPVHLLLSLLHLQIGTHGVQKTHRHHLHPLPPLHHPKNKLCLLEITLTSAIGSESYFSARGILTPSLWERLSPGSSSSHSSSLSTS